MLELTSEFKPSPDQQEAIKGIVKSIKKGNKYQTLLGVTGSGKTSVFLKLWFIQPKNVKHCFLTTEISIIQRLNNTCSICF